MVAAQLKLAAVEVPSILQLPFAVYAATIQALTLEPAFAAEASYVVRSSCDCSGGCTIHVEVNRVRRFVLSR